MNSIVGYDGSNVLKSKAFERRIGKKIAPMLVTKEA
jgi:hypothetical protein